MQIELEPLSFAPSALEPFMSARAIRAHRVLEHRYLVRTAELLATMGYDGPPNLRLAAEIGVARNLPELADNARQALNHAYFWRGLGSVGAGRLAPAFGDLIRRSWGSFGDLVDGAATVADRVFGSGWLWLALGESGIPEWHGTPGSGGPIGPALLCVDLWEHAYWIDYPAERVSGPSPRRVFVQNLLEHVVDWRVVERRLATAARGRTPDYPPRNWLIQ